MPGWLKKVYGDTEGPLGFPMGDAAAKELDGIFKGLPAICKEMGLRHLVAPAKAMDTGEDANGERWDTSFVTTDSLDRDREVLLPKGGDWKSFRRNPVVTFAHDYESLPVGKSVWQKLEQKGDMEGWLAKTVFKGRPDWWTYDEPWFPDVVWEFVKEKYLPGKSVGFIPLNFRAAEEKEIKAHPAWAKARGIIDKWLALEYAVTPVQSNPDALVTGVGKVKSKGIKVSQDFMAKLGLVVPEDVPGLDALSPDDFKDETKTATTQKDPPSPSTEIVLPDPSTAVTLATARKRMDEQAAAVIRRLRFR